MVRILTKTSCIVFFKYGVSQKMCHILYVLIKIYWLYFRGKNLALRMVHIVWLCYFLHGNFYYRPSGFQTEKHYRKRPLRQEELEALANRSDDSLSIEEPYSSDDSIADRNYSPKKDQIDSDDDDFSDNSDFTEDNSEIEAEVSDNVTNSSQGIDADPGWEDTDFDHEIDFNGQPAFNLNLPKDSPPIKFFEIFLDDDIMQKVVDETNRRANTVFRNKPRTRKDRKIPWKDLTVVELKKFLGLCLLGGTVKFPALFKQWSQDSIYYHPLFGKSMGRARFQDILRMLRFINHETVDASDKLHKIKNILDAVLENIKNAFYPGQHLSIDESMILWRGRLAFRQYISNKRHKYGIKLYELTTHDGFILNIIVYTGKGTLVAEEATHTEAVVFELLKDYLDKGHIVYLDNFYNSVPLAEKLLRRKTYIVGTLREQRIGNPKNLLKTKLKKGEAVWRRKGKVVVTKWKDKRDVRMISSMHKHAMKEILTKRGVTKKNRVCSKLQ